MASKFGSVGMRIEDLIMDMIQDGVKVFCSIGYCNADDEKRNPEDIEECPIGCETCDGDCFYYAED